MYQMKCLFAGVPPVRTCLRRVAPVLVGVAVGSFGIESFASEKKKSHGAHDHGSAKLNLVVEGTKLTAVLEVSSDSIYGFEYEPKSDKEKKQRDEGGEKLKANFGKMLLLDASLNCVFANTKLDLRAHAKGNHSETHAEFVATCQKPLTGTKASFAFQSFFPKIKRIQVQIISESNQAGSSIRNDKGDVTL